MILSDIAINFRISAEHARNCTMTRSVTRVVLRLAVHTSIQENGKNNLGIAMPRHGPNKYTKMTVNGLQAFYFELEWSVHKEVWQRNSNLN